MAETIEPVSLRVETEERYLNYAMSVIMSRALPDVRDGLKPVQRRILFTMYHELHLTFDGRPRKCAKIIGDVTGNYHPHGGAAAYEALVRHGAETSSCVRRWFTDRATSAPWTAIRPPRIATQKPSSLLSPKRCLSNCAAHGEHAAQLREHPRGADRSAGAVSQLAGQRHVRHRRRHGDEYAAAQPRRGH